MPLPTWDVFICLFFVVGIAYGLVIRRDKTITLLCATYMGIVIASQFSRVVFDFFNGNKVLANQIWIRSDTPLPIITVGLFLLSIVGISGVISFSSHNRGDVSPIEVAVYSSLNIALILSSILTFLPDTMRLHYMEISRAVKILADYHTAFVIVPPIALVLLNFRRH